MADDPRVTVFVCGSPRNCEHNDKGPRVVLYGPTGEPSGESVSCSKCGTNAYERALWEAP